MEDAGTWTTKSLGPAEGNLPADLVRGLEFRV